MIKRWAWVLLFVAGCLQTTMIVNGFTLDAEGWKQDSWILRRQAAFDLDCPQDEVTLTVLDYDFRRRVATNVGASGCDKRVRYLHVATSNFQSDWVRQN